MLKCLLGPIFFFTISSINAQYEIDSLKEKLFSEDNHMILRSWTNYHKLSKRKSDGKADTAYMHFYNDSIIYHNNMDSSFYLSTKKYYYSIHDDESFVSFRIVDSTYIWGWNYSKFLDFIKKKLINVTNSNDTIYFNLKKNIENLSKVRYYKNDSIHLDLFVDDEYNKMIYFVSMKPTNIKLPRTISERMTKVKVVNDSLILFKTCLGYYIGCYDMTQLPTKHYGYTNK
jgi:hypothetical protein